MKTPKLKRSEFLKLSALFAAGAPLGAKRPSYTAGEGISEMYRTLGGAGLTLLCAGHMHDAAWIAPAEGRPFLVTEV